MQNSCDNSCDNSYDNSTVEYAGFWVRLAAYLLDSIIVFFALLVVRIAVSGIMAAAKGTVLGGNILFQYNLKDIVLYVSEALYFILCTYYTGTTLGKKAMSLRVIRADGEEKLGLLAVVYRETVGRFLSSVIVGIGYIMIGIDKEKRGMHDILCDTRVIYAKRIKVFKIEKTFTPFAEPMGRVPAQEEMPQTYTIHMMPGEQDLKERQKEDSSVQMPADAPQMPWDAPYTGQNNIRKPEVQKDIRKSEIQENDTDITVEKDDTDSEN